VLRELYPNAIQLEADAERGHFWALFPDDADTARVTLLYGTREERLDAQAVAVLAALQPVPEEVGKIGSGGTQLIVPTQYRLSLAA
jgi:hypothetical protein